MRKLLLTASARNDLAKLDPQIRETMIALLVAFAAGEPVDDAPLRGRGGRRLKAGDHRAVVEVTRTTVTALRIRHRSIVYRP